MRAGQEFPSMPFDVPPYRLSGMVYGALFNHRSALAAVGEAANNPPYKGLPRAPVLYIKPRNSLALDGAVVNIPADADELEVGASLGIVIGRTACNVEESKAIRFIAGYLIVADVSMPHRDFFRPAVRFKARDGFCPLGPAVVARTAISDPDAVGVRTYVDGALALAANTADLIRPVARLLQDVTEFMTLAPGDVLAVGAAAPVVRARAGQTVTIEVDGLGTLTNRFETGT